MVDARKQAVSIRMSTGDVRKIKKLAQRLGVRDSDVIRFAVKNMLARLAPLHDPTVSGRGLVPVFVELGVDMVRFFELDAQRIEAIINEGAEPSRRVEHDDIVLMSLMGAQMPYAALLLKELHRSDSAADAEEGAALAASLRQYLYEKYVFRPGQGQTSMLASPVPGQPHVAQGVEHE
jgi:hypothetical protein